MAQRLVYDQEDQEPSKHIQKTHVRKEKTETLPGKNSPLKTQVNFPSITLLRKWATTNPQTKTLLGRAKMAQQVKVFAMTTSQPEFNSWNLSKCEKGEQTPLNSLGPHSNCLNKVSCLTTPDPKSKPALSS